MENHQTTKYSPYVRDVEGIRSNWSFFLILGLLLIVLGAIAVSFNVLTTMFSIIFLGILLLISGIAQVVQSFWTRKWSGLFLSLLMGVLYIVTGFLCIARPQTSAVGLTLLIASFCLIGGLFRMLSSAIMRFERWGWVFFNGLVTFILGIMILSDWPVSGLWVIGLFVGIDMILSGWSWVLLALAIRPRST